MKHRIFRCIVLFALCLIAGAARAEDAEKDPFQVDFDDHVRKVLPGETFSVDVDFAIPKGYYLYDEKTSLLFQKTEGLVLLKSERPKPREHFDPFLKKQSLVYFDSFRQSVQFKVPPDAKAGRLTLEALLRYQGCSTDFCYKPIKREIFFPIQVQETPDAIQSAPRVSPQPEGKAPAMTEPPQESENFWRDIYELNPERLLQKGKVYLLALAFFGGVLTSFTPCVLPIIPLTLAFVGVKQRRRGNFSRTLLLVLGMVTMYSALGFVAASLGLSLGFLFQSPYFLLLVVAFFIVMALGLFDVIPFRLPHRLHNKLVRMGGEGRWGAYLAGLTVGLIASPCVGPLMAPLLLIAARGQDRIYGFSLLLSYGLGMGMLFLLLSSAYAELVKIRGGKWAHYLKKGLGVLMLFPALYYGQVFAKPYFKAKTDAFWVRQLDEGLKKAEAAGKPLLVDFYADWCPPCLELDKLTFSQPEIRREAENFVMVKIDCSVDDANCQKATERYEVVGWPTVLFLRSDGSPISGVKWVGGFADTQKMLELMRAAKARARDQRP